MRVRNPMKLEEADEWIPTRWTLLDRLKNWEEWHRNLVDAALQKVKNKVTPKHYQIFDLLILRRWLVREVVRALNINAAQVYPAKHRVSRLVRLEIEHLQKDLV